MNDIDTLFARMDIVNSKSADALTPADIDDIIAYVRRQRARRASGEKIIRQKEDISELFAEPKRAEMSRRL